ncbi:MAG: hypothetical protein JKY19_09525 [Alcanivoracaceae bacterium]|nr:hypothetical protein [Alcanivoracaceae bacterium]
MKNIWAVLLLCLMSHSVKAETSTDGRRVIKVDMVVLEKDVYYNRLGAHLANAQMYALRHDVVSVTANDSKDLSPGQVNLKPYKRPRPIALRANVGDKLKITLQNLLMPFQSDQAVDCNGSKPSDSTALTDFQLHCAGLQIMGVDWLNANNEHRLAPGESFTYEFIATENGIFMLYSPNGSSIPSSQLDYGLFGAINVQPKTAEWYRSQVTENDLQLANFRTSKSFMKKYWRRNGDKICLRPLGSRLTGLKKGTFLQRKASPVGSKLLCPPSSENAVWLYTVPSSATGQTAKVSDVIIRKDGALYTLAGHPLIDYQAIYPKGHERAGMPVLNMLKTTLKKNHYQLIHSDVTAIITGPDAGRFPYYLNGPEFANNPATPDRRQPYREFTIAYHIAPNTEQAFAAFKTGPLVNTLAAGEDGFAVNYGMAGIAPEIYANRINKGPMGINKDEIDLRFEEFFLSAWAVGDPAMIVDITANNKQGKRATKVLYADDPSNVYHSYMRDHVLFRIMNAGSVAPHVHHQHAHQWLHSRNSDEGHYLDSQLINPGSTYTLEMTYNGSGNRNQTVGDSIFHCHIYPHFAQGMWALWRVHDVFEQGTELDKEGIPLTGARALPDGEIIAGTPIPALVPLPSLGMAPIPAPIQLVDNGRRVKVSPKGKNKEGRLLFDNPGFPFFVPGIAGHRAPHPPLDFAWRENKDGSVKRYSEKNISEFYKIGQPQYLDGGLPRHVVTGGKVAREFHTRWDFTKDFAVYDEKGNFLSGELDALQIPEQGTWVEQAAMAAHAQRSHQSYQPDGRSGNFILNGLPPVPGAPYAAPNVDDDGNSTFNKRRYKAAVIQTDAVFNKEGWHYPQQRFITLLDDVKDTVAGIKPPEPFFFRANTGETVEFWHTNLVPEYFELDDFQVRTPTDILGQHIHLVKFDVTSSDGAANGFNYEDGTFSPDEVKDRINSINAVGGLYHYNNVEQGGSNIQSKLTLSNYRDDYPGIGKPPAGQNWNGAQTTIQRFDTDPLLNNEGEDRTLRTVFTHDHFGPSTHQQVGLYGAMLVEPAGSTWKDPISGCVMPNIGQKGCGKKRSDGGPTSWQAIIETENSVDSYREFAVAVSDMQLAYGPQSTPVPVVPTGVWFSTVNNNYTNDLNSGVVPKALSIIFTAQGAILTNPKVTTIKEGQQWQIQRENMVDKFNLVVNNSNIDVRNLSMDKGWSDNSHAIWPPANPDPLPGGAPYPQIISDPGGGGNIGGWMVNYRNEPLDARLQSGKNDEPNAQDPAYAYSSIKRQHNRLNSQPKGGSQIDHQRKKGFTYPEDALTPDMGAYDPYTPLMRTYAGDKIEVRTVVGAVDSIHNFQIQGAKWHPSPSYENSGYTDSQGFGISEHFEMLYNMASTDSNQIASFVDYLYQPSSSTQGQAKGAWGLIRSYKDQQTGLIALSNNSPGQSVTDLYKPAKNKRSFNITVGLNASKDGLTYSVCPSTKYGKRCQVVSPLILRAKAGEWIEVNVKNNLTDADVSTMKVNLKNLSGSASSKTIKAYTTSAQVGIHAMRLSFDSTQANGMNIGQNQQSQTLQPGESKTYNWYAGNIDVVGGKRVLTPVELGAVNLLPADALLQASFGLVGVLVVEPKDSSWSEDEQYQSTIIVNHANGTQHFTEVVVVGQQAADASVKAGSQVRLRVVNPGTSGPGAIGDPINLITIEGHGWDEFPYQQASEVIASNPQSQWLGTQQVTPFESYTLLLPSAGGVDKVAGDYDYYYYPKGPTVKLGTLSVTQD